MADGYARTSSGGVGCVVVTCGVGSLSAINGTLMSYAEKIPVVYISGTPFILDALKAKKGDIFIHHTTGTETSFTTEAEVFKQVCCEVCLHLIYHFITYHFLRSAPSTCTHSKTVSASTAHSVYVLLSVVQS